MATFYIEAVENTRIELNKKGSPTVGTAKYGVNNTSPSSNYTYGYPINLTAGQKCYWTITNTTTNFSSSNYLYFTSTGKFNVGGNLSDLIGGSTSISRNYCFYRLFYDCTTLINASNLVLLSNLNSKTYCYGYMFYGCISLTQAPALPATILTNFCYMNMFYNCISLTQAPALPATTLAEYCYQGMFSGCASLTQAPALPATTLADYCYQSMFYNCVSLTQAPASLPATTLNNSCYLSMFWNCASLTQAPALPATTLAASCYQGMFYACASLTQAPALPATTLADYCYQNMFYGCTKIKLSETQTGNYQTPYRIPTSGTGTIGANSLFLMFAGSNGTWKRHTPEINKTYYMDTTPSGVSVKYNGSEIANFSKGKRILKCADKKMITDVEIEIS